MDYLIMKTICLNMIVKNESNVIGRCLSSVKDLIDYWVIVDTGSSDGTQKMIQECLQKIPGELHERKWVNFEHNRNVALALARNRADYIFFIDADEILVLLKPFNKNTLNKSFYVIASQGIDARHHRIHLIDRHPGWRWEGVLHESVINSQNMEGEILRDVVIEYRLDGFRSQDPDKFLKDAEVLHQALKKNPENSRYVFYLAQSYLNAKDYPKALFYFEKRSSMQGQKGETFFAKFCVGYLQELLQKDEETVMQSYLSAYHFCPNRIEPLERMARRYSQKGWHLFAYLLSKHALSLPPEIDYNSYTIPSMEEYSMLLRLADSAFSIGQTEESKKTYLQLIRNGKLPKDLQEHVRNRLYRS